MESDKLFEICFNHFKAYEANPDGYSINPFKDPITYIEEGKEGGEEDGEPQVIPETVQQEAIILYFNTKNKIVNKPSLFTFKNGIIFLLICMFLLYMYFRHKN